MQRLLNDRLDWNLLRTFRVIGQEQSISRAAARLHQTQTAVRQALKRKEEKTATLGLSLNRRPQPRLEQRLFLRQRYAFFCGKHHGLFGQQDVAEGDLQRENFVSFTSDQIGGMLSPLTIFRDQQGFSGRIVASSPSLEEVRRLVIAGFGIGCLPEHVVAADVDAGLLWRLPPHEGIADVDIHLLWNREQRMSRAETIFLESLQQRLTD